jgi:estrone sulfotransferase
VSALTRPSSQIARSIRFGSGLLALRGEDFLLASYPRSGSNWTRLVLCNLISLNEWDGKDVVPLLSATMPALGTNNLLRPWPHQTIPRVIKTHRPYSPLLGRVRSIGLIRDPRDVMVSRYHLRRDKKDMATGSFGRFIRHPRHGLESWFKHYASWQGHWTIAVKYEDMLAETDREFTRMLDSLGVRCSDEMLTEAIARSSFRNLQQAEKQRKPTAGKDGLFYRSGSSGQWPKYFTEEDLDLYSRLAEKYDARIYPRVRAVGSPGDTDARTSPHVEADS